MKRLFIILIVAIATVFISCSKSSDRDEDTTTNSCVDYAMGQSAVYDVFKIVHQAANSSKGIALINLLDTTSLFGCDTLIIDTTSNPMTIIIQFNGTCTGNNIIRTGSITATFSSKYDVLGCTTTINFSNYTYKGYTVGTGTIAYTYTGLAGSSPTYSYVINNVQIASNNKVMAFSGNQNLIISVGEATTTTTDDTYTISGSASGYTFAGNEFTATIDTDLTLLGNCEWVSTGMVTVTPENKNPRILNFGSGCDDKATVIIYSTEQEIVIP
ncbi:MAG: hypothetical protein COA97_01870 [Flavobacteriales bacterium]|nr:MAG: hypothetical protein COA97_01870 [Flavobacteriales bacterium]